MHPIARILAVAYVALAAAGAVVLVGASLNYTNVTEAVLNLPDAARVSHVDLAWTGDPSDAATVRVHLELHNPGRVAVEILGFEFELHMDNPEDLRPPFSAAKRDVTRIRPVSLSVARGQGVVVPPGGTGMLAVNVTVEPGTEQMDVLNHPDADGRYHAVVWAPRVVYTFVEFPITNAFHFLPYYDEAGVVPGG